MQLWLHKPKRKITVECMTKCGNEIVPQNKTLGKKRLLPVIDQYVAKILKISDSEETFTVGLTGATETDVSEDVLCTLMSYLPKVAEELKKRDLLARI